MEMQAEVRPEIERDAERNVATLTVGESRYSLYLPHHATDYIQKKIVDEQQPYELQMLEDIQQRVAVDDLVLDIGANIGNHTLYLAAVAGCRVVAFEPNQALAGAILSSVEMNDLAERVSVRAVGVGKVKSRGHFDKELPDNLGAQSISTGEGSIQIIALDDLCFDRPVKLLKIDVEGMELPVLQGAEALLGRDRPLLYVECQGEPDFRAISGWLDGRGYSYWDTFNATPTHLFVPNEQVDIERRLSRLQFKDVLDSYRNREQLTLAKVRLDEANAKYRAAGESIERLKAQLLEQSQQHGVASAELAEGKAEVKSRLDEANVKYRQVTEQLVGLKSQLTGDREARAAAEAAAQQLQQALDALKGESDAVSAKLDDAHSRYQQVAQQLSELTQQLAAAHDGRGAAEERTLQTQRDFEALREERAGLLGELGQVRTALSGAEAQATRLQVELDAALAANQAQQREQLALAPLVEANTALNARLEEANRKFQQVSDQVVSLRGELSAAQSRIQAQQQQHEVQSGRIALLEQQFSLAQARAQELDEQLQSARQSAAQEGRQHEQLRAEHEQQCLSLAEQVADLQQQMASRGEQLQSARQSAVQERRQHEQLRAEYEQQRLSLGEQVADLQQQKVSQGEQLLQRDQDAAAQALRYAELEASASDLQVCLTDSEDVRRQQAEHLALERDARADAESLLEESAAQWQQLRQQLEEDLAATRSWLDAANVKYRAATGEQIPQLKAHLESMRSRSAEQQKKIEELAENLQRANAKRHLAEQRLIKTRGSLTYQLGYQLKSGATSLGGFVRLPGSLFGLYREASKKRKVARQKSIGRDEPPKALPAPQRASDAQRPVLLAGESQARSLMRTPQPGASQVRVACIMDEFSYGSYRHECNLLQLTPGNWERELKEFRPEMLLIESAWRGKDDLWGNKVGHNSQELQGILAWCRANGIPTAFWNKEDPVHFETFLTTAKQFDHVFTTDIDCIHRYKAGLGHERVDLLPFACQPAVHNPIELFQRKDAFCFAGAYYVRYPDRTRDLGNFVAELPKFRPLEIYDRNFGKDDPNYQFPAEYQPYIVGTLPFEQIDTAYKGYRYAINLNSVKQSQSMFARRVFELLGSNTVTVSNYSRGLRLMFGELVVTTDNGAEMLRRLSLLAGSEQSSGKLRLAALRKVMREHTYEQRMNYVLSKALKRAMPESLPKISIIARAASTEQLDSLLDSVRRQSHQPASVCIVVSASLMAGVSVRDASVTLVNEKQLKKRALGEFIGDAQWIAGFCPEDHYGDNYLLDIALATRYSQAGVIGKAAHYSWDGQAAVLQAAEQGYCPVAALPARASAVVAERISQEPALDWLKALSTLSYPADDALAIDPFNYCRGGAQADVHAQVGDLVLDTGLAIEELQARAEAIRPAKVELGDQVFLTGQELQSMFGPLRSKQVDMQLLGSAWGFDSQIEDARHEYLYASTEIEPAQLGATDQVKLFLDTTPGLNLQLVLLMLDAQKQRISHVMVPANRNMVAELPPETAFLRLGLRVYAGGRAEINGLLLGHRDLQPSTLLERSRHLLLTNHYPAYDDLYRNGFVHSRVKAYRQHGVPVDVFRLRKNQAVSYHEFEDSDVTTGSPEMLERMLECGQFDSVLVHFLDADMWEVLRRHLHHTKVTVWVHGAEIQPWWRREYNFTTEEQLQLGKLESEKRLAFWRGVLQPMPANLKLVFVSQHFAETVMEDLGFRLPESQYEIIHNPINTDLFRYQSKPVELRRKILSIRPYHSKTYANDLSVQAIQALSGKPWFKELEFLLVGDGPLFDETLAPLRNYANVSIQRGFLTQLEVARLHGEYGVFLCPSRMDTQGVSRDEAMASGLVPVTNAVAAIPEFVDAECGVLAASESAAEIAQGIERIYTDEDYFKSLSSNAADRVRRQSAAHLMISKELALFRAI
jgi:FkbM family methyltransferase